MRYRSQYPPDWPAISLAIRRNRAKWRCEWCGLPEGARFGPGKGRIRLAVAHLGVPYHDGRLGDKRDKADCRPENLASLCQRCHLGYDRPEHQARAAATRAQKQRERLAKLGYAQLEMCFENSPRIA